MGHNMSEQKDQEIAHLVQSGKIELFGVIVERYEAKMKRYSRKFLSDNEDINDVVQDIFIKSYKNIQSFDKQRKFSSWLYRIAHNELVNALKKKKKKQFLPLFDLDIFIPHSLRDDSFAREIDNQDMKKMISQCLDKLKLKYREPIILYYLEELSYKEISDVLQIPVSTVGIRIKRAKEKIKSLLKNYG